MTKLLEFYFALTTPVRKDERGATATEYGLLVALIALAIVISVQFFGEALAAFFDAITAEVESWA